MAGIFGFFDYTKEGKGVDPNAPPKPPVLEFFAIYGRKFTKIVSMNLLYFLFSLPALALSFFLTSFFYLPLFLNLSEANIAVQLQQANSALTAESALSVAAILIFGLGLTLSFMFVALGFIVLGPVQAGMAFVFRNFAREEHAFLWMDFKQHARSNGKQSVLLSILSLFSLSLLIFAWSFYRSWMQAGLWRSFLSALVVVILIMLSIMLMYMYQMMVTFDLKMKNLIKNALLLSLIKLPMNFLILLLLVLISAVIPMLLLFAGVQPLLLIPYYLLFAFGILQMIQHYYVNRQIQRYMLQKQEEGRQD